MGALILFLIYAGLGLAWFLEDVFTCPEYDEDFNPVEP
jgi:hypothetical protein